MYVIEDPNIKGLVASFKSYKNIVALEDDASHTACYNLRYYPQDEETFEMIMNLILSAHKDDEIKIWRQKIEDRPYKWMIYMYVKSVCEPPA